MTATSALRVDGPSARRFLRFLGLTGLRPEGCGIAAFGGDEYMVSVTCLPLVSQVLYDEEPEPPSLGKGVPQATEDRGVDFEKGFRWFKRFTGFRGCGIALRAMSIKSALRTCLECHHCCMRKCQSLLP